MPNSVLFPASGRTLASFSLATFLAVAVGTGAQVITVPVQPVLGSSNPASAEPPVPHPAVTPCVVTLFKDQKFADYNAKPISYTPPAACPGPWATVVLSVDFTVTAGVQFDRSASFYLGNANIFFGTTAEPRSNLSPSWHVERDLTDLSAVLETAQTGQAVVYNIVNPTYTGIIYGTAQLLFYPAGVNDPAPVVPDVVVPVSGDNNAVNLNSASDVLTTTVLAPRNTERAYLDVIAESQQADELWFLCVPSDLGSQLNSCGGTGFRETEITIDGQSAGVAPVFPWIYTGGIDPYLWSPVVGLQTLVFKPYRVDLTPFAGLLSDGERHKIGVSVFNAVDYFAVTANLLIYEDHGRAETGGGLLQNTLSAPSPYVLENLSFAGSGAVTGTVTTISNRAFQIRGWLNTSRGRVETGVQTSIQFQNTQTYDNGPGGLPELQSIIQTDDVFNTSTSQNGPFVTDNYNYFQAAVDVTLQRAQNPDKSYTQTSGVFQEIQQGTSTSASGVLGLNTAVQEELQANDVLQLSPDLTITGNGPSFGYASYGDAKAIGLSQVGVCYGADVTASNSVVNTVRGGTATCFY